MAKTLGEMVKPFSRRALIRDGALAAGALGLPDVSAAFAGAQAAGTTQGSHTWTIRNGHILRTVSMQPEPGLRTERIADLATGVEYIAPANPRPRMAQEFAFRCDGKSYTGSSSSWTLLRSDEANLLKGKSLTIRLRHNETPLDVDVVYAVYDGHPVVRKHLVLRNTGTVPLHLSRLNIEALGISLGPENETILNAQYGTVPHEIFYTGRSEDAGLLLANVPTGNGIAVLSEVPGYMKRTEIGGWDDPSQVKLGVMYDTDLMPFERTLSGGESFRTASVSLVTFRKGDGFHDPGWVLPSYTSDVLMRRVNEQGPPWIYNTWEPFQRGINHETVRELIEAAGAMGIEVFTIDDGWQQEYGENGINTKAFPDGLQPIMKTLEQKGMRLGLWLPLAAISTTTAEYKAHPEWACRDIDQQPKLTSTAAGTKAVMCLASDYRDAAAARINDAISRFHLAYVKLDLTTIFNTYGEGPGCWAKGHHHGSWAESLNRIYEGIAYVTGKVYEQHPNVLIDITFEVWGQKHVIDAGLLAAGNLDWMSNVDDKMPDSAGPRQARQLLYQRAASMPVESMLIGNMHADLPSIHESFATAIGSAPLLLGDLRRLSPSDREWYRDKIGWFKALRRRARISESFFPLGSWQQPMSTQWDGFARLARTGEGVIALFRNKSGLPSVKVQLPLIPEGRYRLRSVISGKDLGLFSRSDWARGVPVSFSTDAAVEVLELAPARA